MLGSILLSFFWSIAASSKLTEITTASWENVVVDSTKHVFIKFYAPWCGHCKKMKPDWEKLAETYESSESVVIASVDCTSDDSKALCKDVKGFPTLKTFWGQLETPYTGGRNYEALKQHVDELKPPCTPGFLESCTDQEKEAIEKLLGTGIEELTSQITALNDALTEAENAHDALLKNLQEQYKSSNTNLEQLKSNTQPKLQMMKGVLSSLTSPKKDEL